MSKKEFKLDGYANIYLDAIGYRDEKADLQIRLGEIEKEAVKYMRERLMQYLANKHNLSSETHTFAVNTKERKLVVEELVLPPRHENNESETEKNKDEESS